MIIVLFFKNKLIFKLDNDTFKRAKNILEKYNDPSDWIRDIVKIHEKREKMPDFLIVGAAKAGTTSLYNYLIQHPKIERYCQMLWIEFRTLRLLPMPLPVILRR
jgi:hypothetical protein